jgi:hypothetical protein
MKEPQLRIKATMTRHASTDLVHVKYVTSFAKDYGSHLCLELKRNLFLVHFQTKILQLFIISMHATYHVILFSLIWSLFLTYSISN